MLEPPRRLLRSAGANPSALHSSEKVRECQGTDGWEAAKGRRCGTPCKLRSATS